MVLFKKSLGLLSAWVALLALILPLRASHEAREEELRPPSAQALSPISDLPPETLDHIIKFLDLASIGRASQVSWDWNDLINADVFWRSLWTSLKSSSVFCDLEDSPLTYREKVKLHHLRVLVNIQTDLLKVTSLIKKYNLTSFLGERFNYILFITPSPLLIQTLISQGHEQAMTWEIEGLTLGIRDYPKDPEAAKAFNDRLIAEGNTKAMVRQLEGFLKDMQSSLHPFEPFKVFYKEVVEQNRTLTTNYCGDPKNLSHLRFCINELAKSRDPLGLSLYALCLKYGHLGFKRNEKKANTLILKNGIPY
jgi:hypothetical protein